MRDGEEKASANEAVNNFLASDNDQLETEEQPHEGNRRHSNEQFDYERQDYSPIPFQTSNRPTTSYIPKYRMENSAYPIQEVVPNTQMAITSSADPNGMENSEQGAGLRARGQTNVTANVLNVNDFYSRNDDMFSSRQRSHYDGEGSGEGDDNNQTYNDDQMNIPMMIKPKTLYQNPQTPTVLPSTYHPINRWSSVKQSFLKEFLAEFIGTMVLIIFGDCVCCQVNLAAKIQANNFQNKLDALVEAGTMSLDQADGYKTFESLVSSTSGGTFDAIPMSWAAAVVMGYFAAGGSAISGAHLNPSVTISNWIYRGFPKNKVAYYLAGQILGAFCGAMIVFGLYKRVIIEAYPEYWLSQPVANMFCTFPQPYLSTARQFVSELVTTAMFQGCLFALTDPYTCLSSDLFPIMLFFLIYVLNAAMSYQTGTAINMARDVGPRLALAALGFDRNILWKNHHHYFWIPLVAPLTGATMGGLIYDICVYQGHESPVNWPLSVYKEMILRSWHRRPGWQNRNRGRATSDLSDFSYKNDEDDQDSQMMDKKLKPSRTRTRSSGSEFDDEPKQKSVQFKPVKRGKGYTNGVPTILEEEDSIETASLGETGTSMALSDGSSMSDSIKEDYHS